MDPLELLTQPNNPFQKPPQSVLGGDPSLAAVGVLPPASPALAVHSPATVMSEDEKRAVELQKQLELLIPGNRLQELDPYGLKRRSGKTGNRTFGDKAKTGLSVFAEALAAFTGGKNYHDPYSRARERFNEDYKLQAPRIIDEQRILGQNIRSDKTIAAKEAEAKRKAEQLNEITTKKLQLQRDIEAGKLNAKTARDAWERVIAETKSKYGTDSDVMLALMQLETDLTKTASDAEKAKAVSDQLLLNRYNTKSVDAYANSQFGDRSSIVSVPSTSQKWNSEEGRWDTTHSTSSRVVRGPSGNVPPILQQLLPNAAQMLPMGARPSAQPLPSNGGIQPAQGQPSTPPPQSRPAAPLAPPPGNAQPQTSTPTPQVNAAPLTPTQPYKLPRSKAIVQDNVGATITDRAAPLTTQRISDSKPLFNTNEEVTSFGIDKDPEASRFIDTRAMFNNVYRKQMPNGTLIQLRPDGILEERTPGNPKPNIIQPHFRGTGAAKAKEEFEKQRDANNQLNTIVTLAAIQSIRKGGLFTGSTGIPGASAEEILDRDNNLNSGLAKDLNRAVGKAVIGRNPDSIDRFLQLLTNQSYVDRLRAYAGTQQSATETANISKTWGSFKNNPDVFLERFLVIALESNYNMLKKYEQWDKRKGTKMTFLPNDNPSTWATKRAAKIVDKIKKERTFNPQWLSPLIAR